MKRLLELRFLLSFIAASASGLVLYFQIPFPQYNVFMRLIQSERPGAYAFIRYSCAGFLFTTPFFLYLLLTSFLYTFVFQSNQRRQKAFSLPPYPEDLKRDRLFLVVGEQHNPYKPVPAENPRWLNIPERGLFTGIAIFGAIGSGKTSGCMVPFSRQLLSYQAQDTEEKIGGLVLEVKGDFCYKIQSILRDLHRQDDYIEISLDSGYCYNPLHNDLDAYALAYGVASLLNNLFGRGKEPFWQQAYTNLVKFIILLHKTLYDYVTLFDVYECAINRQRLESRIAQGEKLFELRSFIMIDPETAVEHGDLSALNPEFDDEAQQYRLPATDEIRQFLDSRHIDYTGPLTESSMIASDPNRREQFEAVKRWYFNDWSAIDQKLRTSIVEGISVFLSLFDDNPKVKRAFCPPIECYDRKTNADFRYGKPLPSFSWLIEQGKICAVNFPISLNPGLARTIGTLVKMDFQRAVLNRIPMMETQKDRAFREVFFICDEYQHFATTGENDPSGDEKIFSLSRQAKLIPIVATQSVSSLKSTLSGETWRTLLQTFRTKIFLALSDDFSARFASELCGKEDKLKVNYNMGESSQNAKVSFLLGRTLSQKASLTTSKSYTVQRDFIFDQNVFAQLANVQAIVIPYDGLNPHPPTYCYLKPYYLDPNKSYFQQLADKEV